MNTLNDDVKLKSRLDTSSGHKRGYDRDGVAGEGDTDHAQPSEESSPERESCVEASLGSRRDQGATCHMPRVTSVRRGSNRVIVIFIF